MESTTVVIQPPPPIPEGWDTVYGTYVNIHGHPNQEGLMMELSRHASDSVVKLSEQLGVPIGGTIHVFVAPTSKEFKTLQPGRIPEYADGTAWPERGTIFLRRPGLRGPGQRPLIQVLDHEIVHVLLGRVFAPNRPPRWLQEGVAQVESGEYEPNNVIRMRRGAIGGGLHSLRALSFGFPEDPRRADLAYAQSADFIVFLKHEYGEDTVRTLVREMANGGNIDRAVRRATGDFLEDVEVEWMRRFDDGLPLWVTLAGDMDAWWFGLGVAGFFGLIIARRRLRKRMRDYAAEEARQDALLAALLGRPVSGRSGDSRRH